MDQTSLIINDNKTISINLGIRIEKLLGDSYNNEEHFKRAAEWFCGLSDIYGCDLLHHLVNRAEIKQVRWCLETGLYSPLTVDKHNHTALDVVNTSGIEDEALKESLNTLLKSVWNFRKLKV